MVNYNLNHSSQTSINDLFETVVESQLHFTRFPEFLSDRDHATLVYDYLLSSNNECFFKLTYIPFEDLCQNDEERKKLATKLKFGVHLRITKKKTQTNHYHDQTRFDLFIVSGVSLNALKQSQRPPYGATFSKGSSQLSICML